MVIHETSDRRPISTQQIERWGNNSTRERALLPTWCLTKNGWANRKIPRAPQPRLESGKNRSLLPIRRFRLAIASIVPHLSPRISSITDIRDRDNSTSLVESQLTTLRSCRSSRSLYYIIHRVFLDNNIISVLFHGRLSPILLIDFTYLERKKKMVSRFFSIFVMESDRSKPSPFFQEQLIPRSFFSFSHLAKWRASLLSF